MSPLRKTFAIIIPLCLLSIAFPLTASAQSVTFGVPLPMLTGAAAEDLVAGDWNGDGTIDVAVANRDAGTISILQNSGGAVFILKQLIPTGTNSRPFEIIAGDFNRDSKLDLAVVLEGTDQVAILIGKGDGTFDDPVGFTVDNSPRDIAAGDFDGRNGLDLITANEEADSVSVLLNDGDGAFGVASEIAAIDLNLHLRAQTNGVAVGDFNKDGMLDFAVANLARGHVAVALGNGDGTFGVLATYSTTANGEPWAIVAADLNGDGKVDLATANFLSDNVSVLLGNGDGTFQTALDYAAGNGPQDIIAADIDGDGKLDLVTANREGDNVSVLLGKGDGAFKAAVTTDAGSAPVGVAAADLNGDGKVDIATANEESDDMTVMIGGATGGSTIIPGLTQCASTSCGPLGLTPFALTLCGLIGLKSYRRRCGW